jgi:hypothetical protein
MILFPVLIMAIARLSWAGVPLMIMSPLGVRATEWKAFLGLSPSVNVHLTRNLNGDRDRRLCIF